MTSIPTTCRTVVIAKVQYFVPWLDALLGKIMVLIIIIIAKMTHVVCTRSYMFLAKCISRHIQFADDLCSCAMRSHVLVHNTLNIAHGCAM